jgi:hypothetical protein
MILEANNMEISAIKDDRVVITEIEKYANAGMEILIRDVLSDYLIKSRDLKLDSTASKNYLNTTVLYLRKGPTIEP